MVSETLLVIELDDVSRNLDYRNTCQVDCFKELYLSMVHTSNNEALEGGELVEFHLLQSGNVRLDVIIPFSQITRVTSVLRGVSGELVNCTRSDC